MPSRPRRTSGGVIAVVVTIFVVVIFSAVVGGPVIARRLGLSAGLVGAPSVTTPAAPITPSDPPLIRLAAAGDVGTGGEAAHRTAAAIDDQEVDGDYDALLLLGDNVYPNGDPNELERTVFRPFGLVLDNGTQLLAALGNHDVRDGNAEAHREAIGMPARWYATRIDDVLIVALDSTRPEDAGQREWLQQTLASSDATWTIVIMHHPPYSGGSHGSSIDVREAFTPSFERHGVQLVLAGHDHDYQRSEPIEGVTYLVSGGGAKLRLASYADFTAVAWSTHHYLDIAVWDDRMIVRPIDHNGREFDRVELQP